MTVLHQPTTLDEAVALLGATPDAICLAGGQSLVAGMNTGLIQPAALISLRRIPTLRGIDYRPDGELAIGAMTNHATVAAATSLRGGHRLLAAAARHIAHPAIRTQGTMGGSICHADPAADYPGVLLAFDATIELASTTGTRRVPAAEFFLGFLTTARAPDEIVTRIVFPPSPPETGGVYEKYARSEGDFATVSVALALAMDEDRCRHIGLAIGGCGPAAVRSAEAERLLVGTPLDAAALDAACAALDRAIAPVDDVRGSAAYRRLLVPRLVRRAVLRARA